LFSDTGKNFVKTILAAAPQKAAVGEPLRVVDDQVGSPTYAGHLAAAVDEALIAEGRIHPVARAEDVVLHKKDARVLQASLRDPSLFVDALLELARRRSRRARLGRLMHDVGDAGSSSLL
ncbi:MAG: sugar nucleotide-binding protein, partial [Actinomycetes bacterium]